MRNTLAMLAAGALGFAGLGWYLGWFHVRSTPASNGHREINIDVDTKKIAEDVNKEIKQGSQKIDEILHPKGSTQQTVVPGGVTVPGTSGLSTSRFRVEGGVLIDTEGVSTPVPINKGN